MHSLTLGQFMLFLKDCEVLVGVEASSVEEAGVQLLTKRQARLIFAQSMQFSYSEAAG